MKQRLKEWLANLRPLHLRLAGTQASLRFAHRRIDTLQDQIKVLIRQVDFNAEAGNANSKNAVENALKLQTRLSYLESVVLGCSVGSEEGREERPG